MDSDFEKLRKELKDKIDEIIDNHISLNNAVLEVPEQNIYMEFNINNHNYIAFTEDSKETEEMQMMFAKVDFIDGNKILRNIETAEEYESVINEFNRRIELLAKVRDNANE